MVRHDWELAKELGGEIEIVAINDLLDGIPVPGAPLSTWIVPTRVSYSDRDPEVYLLALSFMSGKDDDFAGTSVVPIARVHSRHDGDAILMDRSSDATRLSHF